MKSHGHCTNSLNQGSPTYNSYVSMKKRCYYPKTRDYPLYGGTGIKVCDRWLQSFDNFLADMGIRPSTTHSLDRYPDKNGNYEPGNCRWATIKEQNRNRKDNFWLEYKGRKMILKDWAMELGIVYGLITGRLKKGQSFDTIYEYYYNKKKQKTNYMKKVLFAIAVISLATACKKSTEDKHTTNTTVYLQIEGIDNDNITTTVSSTLTLNITQ